MFKALLAGLSKVGINLTTDCKVYEVKDDKGIVTNVTVFIPWQIAHLTSVAEVQALLPEGWNATASSRDVDMKMALVEGKSYTPSIAIQQGANAFDALTKFVGK